MKPEQAPSGFKDPTGGMNWYGGSAPDLRGNAPTVLDRCKSLLDAQTAKGVSKYGGALDVTRPSAIETADHAAEEAADKLQYSVWLAQIVREELAEKDQDRKQLISEFAADGARLSARIAELETQKAETMADYRRQTERIAELEKEIEGDGPSWMQVAQRRADMLHEATEGCEYLAAQVVKSDARIAELEAENGRLKNHLSDICMTASKLGNGDSWEVKRDGSGSNALELIQKMFEMGNALVPRINELEVELKESDDTMRLRYAADLRAIKRWQEATGRELVWPDHADLCVWLMGELAKADDGWRDASKEKPESHHNVLILDEDGLPHVAMFLGWYWVQDASRPGCKTWTLEAVTHWRELPAPPAYNMEPEAPHVKGSVEHGKHAEGEEGEL